MTRYSDWLNVALFWAECALVGAVLGVVVVSVARMAGVAG